MEAELIAHLRRRIFPHPLLGVGIGDDAAVLRTEGLQRCVLTVDLLADHVDFELAEVDPRRVGRKALAVNLSDLAAMASRPLAGVVSLCLPRAGGMDLAVQLYEGLLPLAEQYGLAIAGGDTNSWDGPLVISVTLLGEVTPQGPLRRSGARPGDAIIVTGAFGGSILGRHLDFEPRVREALLLAQRYSLHAGIDASDGLSLDLAHLLQESGCGAVVQLGSIPIADDARKLAEKLGDGSTPLDHALGDGEDFELILAVPAEEADRMVADQPLGVPLTRIGQFISEPGLWQVDAGGIRSPLQPRGYQHRLD
ncbi:MAG: thiamine-phosphate kinase [Thermoguttaceae bacterium]